MKGGIFCDLRKAFDYVIAKFY